MTNITETELMHQVPWKSVVRLGASVGVDVPAEPGSPREKRIAVRKVIAALYPKKAAAA